MPTLRKKRSGLAQVGRPEMSVEATVAPVVETVDTIDLESIALSRACRFESGQGHVLLRHLNIYRF